MACVGSLPITGRSIRRETGLQGRGCRRLRGGMRPHRRAGGKDSPSRNDPRVSNNGRVTNPQIFLPSGGSIHGRPPRFGHHLRRPRGATVITLPPPPSPGGLVPPQPQAVADRCLQKDPDSSDSRRFDDNRHRRQRPQSSAPGFGSRREESRANSGIKAGIKGQAHYGGQTLCCKV